MPISSRAALLVIDVQNDFIPGGQLPVPEGDLIVPLINRIGRQFKQVIIAQDWHCLLYTSPSPRDGLLSRMPSSA